MDSYEKALTRRELIRLGVTASVASVWAPRLLWGWAPPALLPTPSTVAGPFYPMVRPRERDQDLTHLSGHKARAQGQIIHVVGRVLNLKGEPVAGAKIELWQANTFGRYDHPSDPNPAPLDHATLLRWRAVEREGSDLQRGAAESRLARGEAAAGAGWGRSSSSARAMGCRPSARVNEEAANRARRGCALDFVRAGASPRIPNANHLRHVDWTAVAGRRPAGARCGGTGSKLSVRGRACD